MTLQDVDAVAALEQLSYPFPWSVGIFRDCLRAGYGARVIEIESELAGYVVYSVGAGEGHLLNLCVAERFRRQAIARRVLRFVIQAVALVPAQVLFLEVRVSNLGAIKLYQSLGFEQIGLRKGYYEAVNGREDALVYRLDLMPWL
jgi:ribosomal-protein-alanine N-acetyltransferase